MLYTELVKKNIISMEKLVGLMSENPRKRFSITTDVGYTVFDCNHEYAIDTNSFCSMGKSTPFDGKKVYGECLLTTYNGKAV